MEDGDLWVNYTFQAENHAKAYQSISAVLKAAGVTYLIYRGILEGLELSFFIPWSSVAVVTAGVFVVVFSTMLYAMNKLRKENVMEELRRESI